MNQADLFGDPRIAADRALWEKRAASLRREWRKLAAADEDPTASDAVLEAFIRASVPVGLR